MRHRRVCGWPPASPTRWAEIPRRNLRWKACMCPESPRPPFFFRSRPISLDSEQCGRYRIVCIMRRRKKMIKRIEVCTEHELSDIQDEACRLQGWWLLLELCSRKVGLLCCGLYPYLAGHVGTLAGLAEPGTPGMEPNTVVGPSCSQLFLHNKATNHNSTVDYHHQFCLPRSLQQQVHAVKVSCASCPRPRPEAITSDTRFGAFSTKKRHAACRYQD